jgi:hypothetical protein
MRTEFGAVFGRSENRRRILLPVTAAFFFASSALAQAWLPPKGEATFGIEYENAYTRYHLFSEGERFDAGRVRMSTVFFSLAYSFTDRLAVGASVPYTSARYDGTVFHSLPADDGNYHGGFTDLRLGLHYNLLREPAVVTPFLTAIIPMRDYPTFAHAAPSSGLEQYILGVAVGRRLDPILEAGFAQLSYSYAFVEKVLGVSHDRSNLDLEIGYFFTSSLGISATASYQKTPGGVELPLPGTPAARAFRNSPYFVHHDQLARSDFLNVGGVVSYAVTGTVDVFATYQSMVWGKNVHDLRPGLAVGFTWGFSPQRVIRRIARKST